MTKVKLTTMRRTQSPLKPITLTIVLFFALLVLALGIWLGVESTRAGRQRIIIEQIEQESGRVYYDYQTSEPNATDRSVVQRLRDGLGKDYFGRPKVVYLFKCSNPEERIHQLAAMQSVTDLYLGDCILNEASVRELNEINTLTGLALDGSTAEPRLFGEIVSSHSLTHLACSGEKFSDEHAATLVHAITLTSLQCVRSPITNHGLHNLRQLTQLKHLDFLQFSAVGDEGIAALSGLTKLEDLNLLDSNVSDQSANTIAGFVRLRSLSLAGTQFTDSGLSQLAVLTSLEHLNLRECAISDASTPVIAQFQQLKLLDLHGTQVGDQGLQKLQGLSRIQHLDLSETLVTGSGLKQLQVCNSLRSLAISESVTLTEQDIRELQNFLPQLHVTLWRTDIKTQSTYGITFPASDGT